MNTRSSALRKLSAAFAALALAAGVSACGAAPAGEQAQAPQVTTDAATFSVAVIGPDAAGEPVYYAPLSFFTVADHDGWAATQECFDDAGLVYDASNSEYGVMLNSITSPVDGTVLAWDEAAGTYWQLFVDGKAAEVGIDGVEVKEGTEIVWYYSAFGDALPEAAQAAAA